MWRRCPFLERRFSPQTRAQRGATWSQRAPGWDRARRRPIPKPYRSLLARARAPASVTSSVPRSTRPPRAKRRPPPSPPSGGRRSGSSGSSGGSSSSSSGLGWGGECGSEGASVVPDDVRGDEGYDSDDPPDSDDGGGGDGGGGGGGASGKPPDASLAAASRSEAGSGPGSGDSSSSGGGGGGGGGSGASGTPWMSPLRRHHPAFRCTCQGATRSGCWRGLPWGAPPCPRAACRRGSVPTPRSRSPGSRSRSRGWGPLRWLRRCGRWRTRRRSCWLARRPLRRRLRRSPRRAKE